MGNTVEFAEPVHGASVRVGSASFRHAGRRAAALTSMCLLLAIVAVMAVVPSVAGAAFGVTSFTTSVHDANGVDYTQAGGHPFSATTSFRLATHDEAGYEVPNENASRIAVDLPPGFVGNPQVVKARCVSTAAMYDGQCPPESIVGYGIIMSRTTGSTVPEPSEPFAIHSLEPSPGSPATFAFPIGGAPTVMQASVRSDGDYGLTITSSGIPEVLHVVGATLTFCGDGVRKAAAFFSLPTYECIGADEPPMDPPPPFTTITDNKYGGPFLSLPTQCTTEPPPSFLRAQSWVDPDVWVGPYTAYAHTPPAEPSPVTGCEQLPFDPSVEVAPTASAPDTPTGLNVDLAFPQDGLFDLDTLATAHLKKAVVTLPEGMTINPAGANGLTACSDAQLKLKSKAPVECPGTSKVGTVTAKSPLLEEELTGGVFIRSQNSSDPESGEMFRLALVLENEERGISVRLPGQVRADAGTGRLVTTFDNNPQLPVSDINVRFKGGPTAPLATPATCGPKTVGVQLTSWGGQTVNRTSSFNLDCVAGLGGFAPAFSAGMVNPTGRAFSPFALNVEKPDGDAAMDGVSLRLPTGLLAKIKGNLNTQVGAVSTFAGPGGRPFMLPGTVTLEGPYGDAPYSLRVVVPAKAGPFDLGDVVVRQKIYVDPVTAQVSVVSDRLPTIVKGVPVRLQRLDVNVDRPEFTHNPSDCSPKQVQATLAAGGARAEVASRFQAASCAALPFKPRIRMQNMNRGRRSTLRSWNPRMRFVVRQQGIGEAGISGARVTLPSSVILDQSNLDNVCTRAQMAAKDCPAGSVVGYARAFTPLLNRPVQGPVYLAANGGVRPLPDVVAVLDGEVKIVLESWIDTVRRGRTGRLRSTFNAVPDAPISRFVLTMRGGKKNGLLVNSTDLCRTNERAVANFSGHNGKRSSTRPRIGLRFKGCKKARRQIARRAAKRKAVRSNARQSLAGHARAPRKNDR